MKLTQAVRCKPETVNLKNEDYIFDFMGKNNGKAVFVTIFHDEKMTVGQEEYEKLERTVSLCQPLADNYI